MLRYVRPSGLPGASGVRPISAADLNWSDERLLAGAAGGDQKAFEQIYERHARVVYSLLLRMTRESPVAEELTQEVFLRVWRRASSFDAQRGQLRPWLLQVARNLALDRIRGKAEQQRGREHELKELTALSTAAPRAEAWVEQRTLAHQACAFMAELPDGQRRALELAYFEGLSHSEIATRLDSPIGTVKSWVRKGLLQLRDSMRGGAA